MGNIIVSYKPAASSQKARRRVSYTISLKLNLFAIQLFATKVLGTLSFPPSPIGRLQGEDCKELLPIALRIRGCRRNRGPLRPVPSSLTG
jgi:hypothetical protein